jgi:TolB protein
MMLALSIVLLRVRQQGPSTATWIAFESNRDDNFEIYRINPDGSGLRRLTFHPKADINPVWSPDGQWVEFGSDRSGRWQIYRMHPDGSNLQPVAHAPRHGENAVWSPDGQMLVYVSYQDGNWELYRSHVGGRLPQRLTFHPADDLAPTWSPAIEVPLKVTRLLACGAGLLGAGGFRLIFR